MVNGIVKGMESVMCIVTRTKTKHGFIDDNSKKEAKEILSCPFCGSQPELWNHKGRWWVDCRELDCQVNPGTSNDCTREMAINQWNKRK